MLANWEELKAAEKGRASLMEGIPSALPALAYAAKVQKKAASVGFDWDDVAGALPKIAEELGELVEVLGEPDGAARGARRPPVRRGQRGPAPGRRRRRVALRAATAKFRARFEGVELLAADRGLALRSLDLAALDALWDEVKASARS